MPPDQLMLPGVMRPWPTARLTMALPQVWRAALIRLAVVWAGLVAALFHDWAAMAEQWWNNSTYTHVLLIPPILVWLVVQRAGELVKLSPQAWWPGLGAVGLALVLWMAGQLAGLAEASQLGAVALLIGSVMALLGPRVTAGLAFPLAYMVFLVPLGGEMIPALQLITARLTVVLVHISHIPAAIDGVFITTPAGLFKIAEACSGMKFLAAMVAFGALAGNVCFRRWWRRLLFLVACVVVPVLANVVRAWGTIYVAQFMGAAYAGGFDHIIYGWIFFAIVITVILGVSWRFFDRPAAAPMIDAGALLACPRLAWWERLAVPVDLVSLWVPIWVLALVLGGVAWVQAGTALEAPTPAHIDLPMVPGWHRVDYAPRHAWQPRATGAAHRLLGRYADGAGHEVDVFFALYATQGDGHKVGGFGDGAIPENSGSENSDPGNSGWAWQAPGPWVADALSQRLLADGTVSRLAETSYGTGNLVTGQLIRLRLANLWDRLLLRRRTTMMLIISTEERPGRTEDAVRAIQAFRHAIGPLQPWMSHMARAG